MEFEQKKREKKKEKIRLTNQTIWSYKATCLREKESMYLCMYVCMYVY